MKWWITTIQNSKILLNCICLKLKGQMLIITHYCILAWVEGWVIKYGQNCNFMTLVIYGMYNLKIQPPTYVYYKHMSILSIR